MTIEQHPTRHRRREQPIQKAARLIAEDKVRLTPAQVYLVAGDHDLYRVIAGPEGIFCSCPASTPLCAHALAVASVWAPDRGVAA